MKPTIAVTGSDGQLGWELQQLASSFPEFKFVFTNRSTLDISNADDIDSFIKQYQPVFLINAAAYTAVDKAETDRETALLVNATAVGLLAQSCYENNCGFIHISTDYVFNGNSTQAYRPDEKTDPVNYYGYTKLKGEQLALTAHKESIIIRTSWVYSAHGNNFVKTMLRLMQSRDSINVVSDQQGCPTYAKDLAKAILNIIQQKINGNNNSGIYHFSNDGVTTWYDFAQAIKNAAGLTCAVNPITTADYPTPAKRPAYSVMDTQKIVQDFGITLQPWQTSLESCIKLIDLSSL